MDAYKTRKGNKVLETLTEQTFTRVVPVQSHHANGIAVARVSNSSNDASALAVNGPTRSRVLIVADEPMDRIMVNELERNGFAIVELDTDATIERVRQSKADALILMSNNAFEASQWCRTLRANRVMMPMHIMLTTYTSFDEALLLELGADWVADDSAEPRVIASRLRAMLRRTTAHTKAETGDTLQFGRLLIDASVRQVVLAGNLIDISSSEFDLLWLLASRAGEVLKRDEVQIELRGFASLDSHRFIDARLYRLRQRLGNTPEVVSRIRSVRPYGYLFAKVDW